ncbi:MAG: hypothetical protein Q9159_005292 [Coniocarpon cinnabarinum]
MSGQGRPQLKDAIANSYSAVYGKSLDKDENIAVTSGATAGLLSVFEAFLEADDEVIVLQPVFNL